MPLPHFPLLHRLRRGSPARRGAFALILACSSSLVLAIRSATERTNHATERLNSAAERLDSLTDGGPYDDARRAAVAWGYAERLRLGLESPFRLIESASRDPRLAADERRTVSEALLAHVLAGETHEIDPAALDGIGPTAHRRSASGEQHLALLTRAVGAGDDPRAGELGVRVAYSLAATERLVETSTPALVAAVAALLADREIARREARSVVRADGDPVAEVRARRHRRGFYVERPTLFAVNEKIERTAMEISRWVLDSLRAMQPMPATDSGRRPDTADVRFAAQLFEAGRAMPPAAPLAVSVKRYLPLVRSQAHHVDATTLGRTRNAEMLAAAATAEPGTRTERRAVGRLLVTAAVAMRTQAQEAVWFPGDSAPSSQEVAATLGVSGIDFDADVPKSWRPYFLRQFAEGVADLRRVLPGLQLQPVHVRFRMTVPADSALAMHDPRSRTLHLPVGTAGGTLTHELAHELDRQVAVQQGHLGYRSDFVARNGGGKRGGVRAGSGSVSASLRALTEERGDASGPATGERPAEVFATQVDWFVAKALASRGISSGFLTAVQDELLTGHVVHPERLRAGTRARPLLDALRGMTTVAPFAVEEPRPGLHALLGWALSGPVDRDAAAAIVADASRAWDPPTLERSSCAASGDARVALIRMAAESRARGWLRMRARWARAGDEDRPAWVRSATGQGPWSPEPLERRVERLTDHILLELSSAAPLPAGLSAVGAPLAARARCDG